MSDLREQFLTDVIDTLIVRELDAETITMVRNAIALHLNNYEMTTRCTDIAVRDTSSEQLIKLFIGTMMTEGKREKTLNIYFKTIQRFYHDCGKPLTEVSKIDVLSWLAKIQQRTSLVTCENYRSYLSSFYKWMQNEEIIQKNPMQNIKTIKTKDKIKYPFSDTEIDQIRGACNSSRDRAIVEILLSSGVRCSELCQLDVSDIDFQSLEILIRDGKGGKQRKVYINEVAAHHIKIYLEERKDDDLYMFASRKHCRITPTGIRFILKTVEKESGVKNVHPHRFRRTFATNCIKKKMDIRTLQMIMGHTDISTTMGYISLDSEHLKNQYKQIM